MARSRILNTFPTRLDAIACEKAIGSDKIAIWFADEARIGQKNKITRRSAKRGTRPNAPHDQRTVSTYIFGAVCPKEGNGESLILPACTSRGPWHERIVAGFGLIGPGILKGRGVFLRHEDAAFTLILRAPRGAAA